MRMGQGCVCNYVCVRVRGARDNYTKTGNQNRGRELSNRKKKKTHGGDEQVACMCETMYVLYGVYVYKQVPRPDKKRKTKQSSTFKQHSDVN
jgi:hypothetical protein